MAEVKKATPKPSVSVCILTKNDEATIEECIESVKDFAREIVVLDIGSTDNTVNIVRNHTTRIWGFKWNKDYADVWNGFFKYASSDWILFLYGYEKVSNETKKFLNPNILNRKNVAYLFKLNQMYHDKDYTTFAIRMFRRLNEIKFKQAILTNVNDDVQKISKKQSLAIIPTDIEIDQMYYRKYRDDSEYHYHVVDITSKALDGDKKLEPYVNTLYRLLRGLSFGCLGEYDDAEEEVGKILDEIRAMDKKAAYNVPIFIEAFVFFCYYYSKKKDYEKALEIIKEGVEIYHNSLTVLVRYAEQLYMNREYKDCLETLHKIKTLTEEEGFYYLESINFYLIERLTIKLFNLVKEKLAD